MTRLSLGFCATYLIHCQVYTSCSFIVYANDTRTRNRRRKQIPETGTINRHKTRASSYSLSKIGTRKIRHQIVRQMLQKPVPVFWNWFLAPISGTCVILLLSSQPSIRLNSSMTLTSLFGCSTNIRINVYRSPYQWTFFFIAS